MHALRDYERAKTRKQKRRETEGTFRKTWKEVACGFLFNIELYVEMEAVGIF